MTQHKIMFALRLSARTGGESPGAPAEGELKEV